jgi:hypothetical protein
MAAQSASARNESAIDAEAGRQSVESRHDLAPFSQHPLFVPRIIVIDAACASPKRMAATPTEVRNAGGLAVCTMVPRMRASPRFGLTKEEHMDSRTLDSLARALGSGQSRRRLLKTLAGGALASTSAAIGMSRVDAARLRSVGNSCASNADCASGLCVQQSRTRKICHCASLADCPAGDQCHAATCLANGSCGMTVTAGASCTDGVTGTCNDVCQTDGTCAGTAVDLQTDPGNCGSCGDVCTTSAANANAICAGGTCGFTCNAGYQSDGAGGCKAITVVTCAAPSGVSTYGGSCYGAAQTCTAEGTMMSAYCQEANYPWNYYPTSINVNTCQAQGYVIANCNGALTCGEC